MHPTCISSFRRTVFEAQPAGCCRRSACPCRRYGYIGDENYSRHPFWDWASGNYSRVIVVPGNHEFYKMFDIDKLYNGWSLKIRENITCHYNRYPIG